VRNYFLTQISDAMYDVSLKHVAL